MPLFVRPVVCLFGPSSYVYGLDSVNLVDLLLKREVLFGSKTDDMYMVSLGKRIIWTWSLWVKNGLRSGSLYF